MSNLLKSKFLLGVMTVAIMFVGVVAVSATTASAASCTITSTLRVGSKGADVKCLQAAVGVTADGSFGPKTAAAVKVWQAANGLTADGVFGPKSNAELASTASSVSMTTYPAGCTSASGYSPTTGTSCSSGAVTTTTYPAGCTSASGYSPTTGASCATGAVNNQTGPVQVSLASNTPASGYIIGNQATADLAHFTFTGTGTINSVVLQRTGVSDQSTLSNVYLYNGTTRLTDGFSFNNVGQLTMNSLGIAVNGSVTLSVKADVALVTNASTLGITLTGFTAAGQTATTVSVAGNQMTYGLGSLASITINTNTVGGTPTVNAGTSAYTVWSAPVQVNTRAVWLKGANFRMTGSAPAASLGNIKLYVDGVQVGSTATIGTITGSNYAMFDFSATPVSLQTGSHTVDVRADIVSGSSYTVTVSLQQASDLVVYDGQVGVNIAVQNTGPVAFTANSGALITINAGSASVAVDPTFQTLTNITGGATNVAIGRFKIHGYGEDVKVTTLVVKPVVTGGVIASGISSTTDLNNVTVYFNGSQVGSSANYNGTDALSFNLGSQMILPAGSDSYIEIRADLQNDASVNYTAGTVSAALNGLTNNAQGQTSHTTISFPAATGVNTTGTSLTIQTGLLAVSKNTGYASQNVNPNTANTKVGSFTLQNQSSSESVRVTSLSVSLTQSDGSTVLTSTSTPALTNFSNLRTSETSGSGAIPVQPSGTNTFSVNFTIAPGATKTIDVLADTGSAAASAQFSSKLIVTSIGSTSNVSVTQNGGSGGGAVSGQVLTLAIGTLTNAPTILASTTTAAQYVSAANGGAQNVAKATFNIAATGGNATISEMKFAVNTSDVSTAASAGAINSTGTGVPITITANAGFAVGDFVKITATTPAYGIVESNSSTTLTVSITSAGTGTPTLVSVIPSTVTAVTVNGMSAPVVSGIAYLTGLNLAVPNGSGGLNQDVYTSYAEVSTNGLVSGATSRIALVYVKYQSGNTTGTLCTAAIAACLATDGVTAATLVVGGVSAPTMTLVGSSPTFTATQPTATLAVGNIEVIDVTVTANAKGNIALNKLSVTASPSSTVTMGSTANTVIVKDSNNQTVTTTSTAFTTGAGVASTSTITFGTSGYTVSGSQTFHIYVPVAAVTGSGVNSSSLSTTLATTAGSMTWTDLAGSATVAQGATATLAASLPTALIPSFPSTFTSLLHN